MNYGKSHYYSVVAAFPGSGQKVPGSSHPLVAIIQLAKWHVAFEDPKGMTHHILNCEVSTAKVLRSEETDQLVSPIRNPAQIIKRITHYTCDGNVIKEYELISKVTFNDRRREVSFVTPDGQPVVIKNDPVVICDHFRPYDASTDPIKHPTFAPIHPGTVSIRPDGSVNDSSV